MKPAQNTPGGPSDSPNRTRSRAYTERPRRIPPELAHDERLEFGCSVLATLLLYRVITFADDQGRLPGHAKYLRSVAFGMRDEISVKKVEVAIGELVDAGFLLRYKGGEGGRELVQVVGWWDLQGSWGRRAYPSRYPAPPGWSDDRTFGLSPSAGELPTDGEHNAPPTTSPSTNPSPTTPPSTYTAPPTDLSSPPPTRRGHGVSGNGSYQEGDPALEAGMALVKGPGR